MMLFPFAFFCCLVFTRVTTSTGTSQDCPTSCEALADRIDALEEKWTRLSNRFSDDRQRDRRADGNSEPEREYQCYRGMTSRVRVNIPDGNNTEALCDIETDDGGWIVIQRRADGVEDFYRNWEEYKHGFGTVKGDYWLGNEDIHRLTSTGTYELRIDMKFKGTMYYARYSSFVVQDESSSYKMTLGTYSGNSGDSLSAYHSNMKFSTYDKDNDLSAINCALIDHGGWWYNGCFYSNLNGEWGDSRYGIGWAYDLTRRGGPSLSFIEMKIRQI